jgi:hypothetical protein
MRMMSLAMYISNFERIETQSIIRQLAQAVENSLKAEHSFSQFVWKS